MAIHLADLQKRTRTVRVSFQGEELNVTYKINIVTPAFLAEKLKIEEQLARAIEGWDLLGEDGKPVPITYEVFEVLPTQFQAEIMMALTDDMRITSDEQKKI